MSSIRRHALGRAFALRVASLVSFAALATAVPPAFAQQPATPVPPPPDAILGFEVAGAWQVSTSASAASSSLTPVRTQGGAALDLTNAGNNAKLVSLPVASTAPQLARIGAAGAAIAVDIRFPGRPSSNPGSLRLSITSPSRGLNKIPLGKVDLAGLHAGTYQTITFPMTDQARKALGTARFTDLSFELVLTSQVGGEYLFDNLRVRSVGGVTADATTRPPAGYGGSVDLDLTLPDPPGEDANAPVAVEQTFDVGAIQVPDRLRLKAGTALGSARLEFGYSPTAIVASCLFLPDTLDTTQRSYVASSCTGGPQPGDIMSASWVRLTERGGVAPLRLRAQLARRPLGDQIGSGLIPPMPTFWGDEDTCTSQPVAGQVVSTSQSCADTLAATSKIVSDYFTLVATGHTATGWIVPPVPESAKRHGDDTEATLAAGLAPLARSANMLIAGPSNASLVNESGHLNKDGLFDAYWALNGGLTYNSFPDTDRATTHLDADFSAHGVLFGLDANVLDVSASADTDTGQSIPFHVDPSSRIQTHLHVLGIEYPAFTTDSPGQISKSIPLFSPAPLELGELRFWIFKISLGVKAVAGLELSGGLEGKGIDLAVTPEGSVQGSLFGGVDVFVASGGVEANVDLIRVKAPVSASATWLLDRSPASCSGEIVGGLDGDVTVSSGGGEVDLVASYGICPFCDDESVRIFDWDPVVSHTIPIVHKTLNVARFQLPVGLCTGNAVAASIRTPNSDNGVVYGNVAYDLTGIASSTNVDGISGQAISCSNFTWSVSAPDTVGGTGCNAHITFANTPHQAQIGLIVSHQVTDAFGRVLTETGSATRSVNVTQIVGVKILSFLNMTTNLQGQTPLFDLVAPPDGYVITGSKFAGNANPVRYTWRSEHNGVTQDICSQASPQNCILPISHDTGGVIVEVSKTTQTYWMPTEPGLYTITFIATDAVTGAELGRDTTTAQIGQIVR